MNRRDFMAIPAVHFVVASVCNAASVGLAWEGENELLYNGLYVKLRSGLEVMERLRGGVVEVPSDRPQRIKIPERIRYRFDGDVDAIKNLRLIRPLAERTAEDVNRRRIAMEVQTPEWFYDWEINTLICAGRGNVVLRDGEWFPVLAAPGSCYTDYWTPGRKFNSRTKDRLAVHVEFWRELPGSDLA